MKPHRKLERDLVEVFDQGSLGIFCGSLIVFTMAVEEATLLTSQETWIHLGFLENVTS